MEVLIVTGIMVVLAAISFPVFASMKASAKKTVCKSNLRQFGFALSLYREQYARTDQPASSAEMGFPPTGISHEFARAFGVPVSRYSDAFTCAEPNGIWFRYWPFPPDHGLFNETENQSWIDYVSKLGDKTVVIGDTTDHLRAPSSKLMLRRVLGLTISGSLVQKSGRERPGQRSFWLDD